ncbi:hypothetical protein [Brevundimonas lenta]|uniref:Uncharacterized protein n=1 Tax=Brevundimonas lenta TaxID=424796 RepID=A0A7W6JCR1_9CAUL|nr:hypothetical protein [Brevundimonas lenta]MBB4082687.1 hypothetical protein [Brevundimonas lenta]
MALSLSRLRFWLNYYRDEVGFVRAITAATGVILLITSGLLWLTYPAGPVRPVEGRIIAVGFMETDRGSRSTASVSVDGRPVRIQLPARYGCRKGDRIALKRRATRFGFSYGVGRNPKPCSMLTPFSQQ